MDVIRRGAAAVFRRRRRRANSTPTPLPPPNNNNDNDISPPDLPELPASQPNPTSTENTAAPTPLPPLLGTAPPPPAVLPPPPVPAQLEMDAKAKPLDSPPPPECLACCEPASTERPLFKVCLGCTNFWCGECIRQVFVDAIKKGSSMPAKCCLMIPLHFGAPHMSTEEITEYKVKFEEWGTFGKDKVYCPQKECGAFVPLRMKRVFKSTDEKVGEKDRKERADSPLQNLNPFTEATITCSACSTHICLTCKSHAHNDVPCDPAALQQDDSLVAQLVGWGYKRCPRCGHGVRKMHGCGHMQCLCGEHWCWWCARTLRECENSGDCEGSVYDDEDPDDSDNYTDTEYDSEEEEDEESHTPIEDLIDELIREAEHEGVFLEELSDLSQLADASPEDSNLGDPMDIDPLLHDLDVSDPMDIDARWNGYPQATPIPTPRALTPDPVSSPSTDEPDQTIEEPETPAPRRRRRRNLDAGSANYWEEQDLDFGDEPQDDSHATVVWDGMYHTWQELKAHDLGKIVSAEDSKKRKKKEKAMVERAVAEPECHYCWTGLKVETARQCGGCAIVVCGECTGRLMPEDSEE